MGKICAHLSLLLIFYNNTHPTSHLYIDIPLHIKRIQKVNYNLKKY